MEISINIRKFENGAIKNPTGIERNQKTKVNIQAVAISNPSPHFCLPKSSPLSQSETTEDEVTNAQPTKMENNMMYYLNVGHGQAEPLDTEQLNAFKKKM